MLKIIKKIAKFFKVPVFEQSFHKSILKKGIFFSILFYVFLLLFFVEVFAGIFYAIISNNYFTIIFSIMLLLIFWFLMKKRDLYRVLFLLFAWSPITFIVLLTLPILQMFSMIGNLLTYTLIILHSFILGLLMHYMFNKVSKNSLKHILSAIKYSVLLAFIFANNNFIKNIINALSKMYQVSINNNTTNLGVPALFKYFNATISNQHIGFLLALIFFNLPFFIQYRKNKKKVLLLLLIPIITYLFLVAGLNIILKLLM
jgi:hypothetical protein